METTTQAESFKDALNRFLISASAYRASRGIRCPQLSFEPGAKKYIRVVTDAADSRSVFCFVEISTGNVLKAAGWSGPAKGARGTIYTDHFADYGITEWGAQYR